MLKIVPAPGRRPVLIVDESRLVYSPFDVARRVAAGGLLSQEEMIALSHLIERARQTGEADAADVFDLDAAYQLRDPREPTGILVTCGDALVQDADNALTKVAADARARQSLGSFGLAIDGYRLKYTNPHKLKVRQ